MFTSFNIKYLLYLYFFSVEYQLKSMTAFCCNLHSEVFCIDLTLHLVTGTPVRFSSFASQVSFVAFQSTSYCSQLLGSSAPERLTSGTVSLRLCSRLQPHACLLATTAGSRHQWSGVKPWKTIPTYTPAKGNDSKQSRAKIRFWQRPKVPISSRRSSKVAIATRCLRSKNKSNLALLSAPQIMATCR